MGPVHRYVVVGMIATDKPIDGLAKPDGSDISEIALDGDASGLGEILAGVRRVKLLYKVGDAVGVLTSLGTAWPDRDE